MQKICSADKKCVFFIGKISENLLYTNKKCGIIELHDKN